jgi:hypothetical protein
MTLVLIDISRAIGVSIIPKLSAIETNYGLGSDFAAN